MTRFLIDTSVLSAFAPDRPPVPEELQSWMEREGEREALFVSAIVVVEIQHGISKLRRAGGTARADRLERWLEQMLTTFGPNVLMVDTAVARLAGEMEDAAIARGRHPGLADVLIAATARHHAMTVATANMKHFSWLGVECLDPFPGSLPAS